MNIKLRGFDRETKRKFKLEENRKKLREELSVDLSYLSPEELDLAIENELGFLNI